MRFALIAVALLTVTGAAVAQMYPCAIAINHCWTGPETTQTINRLLGSRR